MAEPAARMPEDDAEIAQLRATIAALRAEVAALEADMELLKHSASWRISAPVRVAGRFARRFRAAGAPLRDAIRSARPHQTEPMMPTRTGPSSPTSSHNPHDPNARLIFQPAPELSSGEAAGVVTLDALYRLSRSL